MVMYVWLIYFAQAQATMVKTAKFQAGAFVCPVIAGCMHVVNRVHAASKGL